MSGRPSVRRRFWIEIALAVAAAALTALTLISREWIELVFSIEPDAGSGLVEWAIVVALATTALTLSVLARREWRRLAVHPSS